MCWDCWVLARYPENVFANLVTVVVVVVVVVAGAVWSLVRWWPCRAVRDGLARTV